MDYDTYIKTPIFHSCRLDMPHLTHVLSDHIMTLFIYKLTLFSRSPDEQQKVPVPLPSLLLSTDLVTESERIAVALADAYKNPSSILVLYHH